MVGKPTEGTDGDFELGYIARYASSNFGRKEAGDGWTFGIVVQVP
jgi:hypothetical protein